MEYKNTPGGTGPALNEDAENSVCLWHSRDTRAPASSCAGTHSSGPLQPAHPAPNPCFLQLHKQSTELHAGCFHPGHSTVIQMLHVGVCGVGNANTGYCAVRKTSSVSSVCPPSVPSQTGPSLFFLC